MIEEATLKRAHADSHDRRGGQLADFRAGYTVARRPRTLDALTP